MNAKLTKRLAIRLKVAIEGDIETYAKAFLAIYNNYKNDKDLLKVYNDYDNGVYLVCESHVQDEAIRFLGQFGTITRIDTVEVVQPELVEYTYRDDIDTEFLLTEE